MRSAGFALATILVAASFVGCPLLKKKLAVEDDAGEETVEDAATVAVTSGAKNEASVLRYANETPIDNEPAVIGKDGTKARNFPGNGPEVATLAKGTVVAKIAKYFSTGVLVMFDDPSGDGTKLIGWVSPSAFDVTAPAPTKTVFVPPKVLPVVDAGSKTIVVRDAGVKPIADAGSIAKDAGAPPKVVDAGGGGGGLPQPSKGAIAVAPVDGKCPTGWMISSKMCRRKCAKEPDPVCPRTTKCVAGVCSTGN